MVKTENESWFKELLNSIVSQMKEDKEDITSLFKVVAAMKEDHSRCREAMLTKHADSKLEVTEALADIKRKLAVLAWTINLYTAIYTAALIYIALQLFEHLKK